MSQMALLGRKRTGGSWKEGRRRRGRRKGGGEKREEGRVCGLIE